MPIMIRLLLPLVILLAAAIPGRALTLENARVGFTARRLLVFDGQRYLGRIWHMPGEERHEQNLGGMQPAFILHDGSAIADLVVPQLHTAAELPVPPALHVLESPQLLKKPVGRAVVNGVPTTKYAVDETTPAGRATGYLWLSAAGIPMKCDGRFRSAGGHVTTIRWELRNVQIGPQPQSLFVVPKGFTILPPQALAPLIGLRLKGPAR